MLERKQNVFDDFIAAAEWLIANRVTTAGRLAISGRSNGGLLVGAALTQRPDLFRAVVCGVPLLDMLRYHRFRIAAALDPRIRLARRSRGRSAGCRRTRPTTTCATASRYPAVLLHTAASDTRVDPMHARKMTARLQAANPRRQAGAAPPREPRRPRRGQAARRR